MFTSVMRLTALLLLSSCASSPSPTIPVLADSYVLIDGPLSKEASEALPNIVDGRAEVLERRIETSRGVVLSDQDFQSSPLDAIKSEFFAYAKDQWKADDKLRLLAAQEVRLTEFTITYLVGPADSGKISLSQGIGVGVFDLMVRGAFGQIGDFRLSATVLIGEHKFSASEVLQFGANGGLVPAYASRWIVSRVGRNIAAQVLEHAANRTRSISKQNLR